MSSTRLYKTFNFAKIPKACPRWCRRKWCRRKWCRRITADSLPFLCRVIPATPLYPPMGLLTPATLTHPFIHPLMHLTSTATPSASPSRTTSSWSVPHQPLLVIHTFDSHLFFNIKLIRNNSLFVHSLSSGERHGAHEGGQRG